MKKFMKIPSPAPYGSQTYTDIAGCPSYILKRLATSVRERS